MREVDLELCAHYAGSFANLNRDHFDELYWILFAANILLLSFISFWYSRTSDETKGLDSEDARFRYLHRRCLIVSACCASVSVVIVIIEVFALLALQFCNGEDLISLYWATWTMLQFGSVIAIFGIILHMALVLQGQNRPPWALALGTPVLVVAGLGNLINSALHRKGTKVIERSRSRSRATSKAGSLNMSQSPTINDESIENMDFQRGPASRDPPTARVGQQATWVGTTPDGGVIIQFAEPNPDLESRGTLLSREGNGRVMVSFSRGKVVFADEQQTSPQTRPKSHKPTASLHVTPPANALEMAMSQQHSEPASAWSSGDGTHTQ